MKTSRKVLVVGLIVFAFCGSVMAQQMTYQYSGYATYDNQPATMTLTFARTGVTGTLSKEGECGDGIRLTETRLALTGSLTGQWEGTGVITGTWTGGDSVCGNPLTAADGYPQNGTFKITMTGNTVQLLRTGAPPLPSGYTYDFGATGRVYSGDTSNWKGPVVRGTWNSTWPEHGIVDDPCCAIEQDGAALTLRNPAANWSVSARIVDGRTIEAADGGTGVISEDATRITWSNGGFWERRRSQEEDVPEISGNWNSTWPKHGIVDDPCCAIEQDGAALILRNPAANWSVTARIVGGRTIEAADGGTGVISEDATRITWSNGGFWERRPE